ncbi:MAG: cupredoxin domain-containing protein [Vulcanimicrobiaceae bacterium]
MDTSARRSVFTALAAALVCAVAFAIWSLAGSPGARASDASPSPAASPAATVTIKNFAYDPDPITIKAGEAIRFTNKDSVAHTVTSTTGLFDSGNLDQGASWTHVFAKPGSYPYLCTYHTYMTGTIVVK